MKSDGRRSTVQHRKIRIQICGSKLDKIHDKIFPPDCCELVHAEYIRGQVRSNGPRQRNTCILIKTVTISQSPAETDNTDQAGADNRHVRHGHTVLSKALDIRVHIDTDS